MTYTYPGVYIQELPSPVHAITGVATSIAAFVGYTARGIDNRAQAIFSFADYERLYGGLASDSELSYAVAQFYQNAPGSQAYVVRTPRQGATNASVSFANLTFTALSSGNWANGTLIIDVDQGPPADLRSDSLAFNVTVGSLLDGASEYFPNVTLNAAARNFVGSVINDPDNGSQLAYVDTSKLGTKPNPVVPSGVVGFAITPATLNNTIGNKSATASGDWGLVISTSNPATTAAGVSVTVFADGTPIPQSLSGVALHLQQKINQALATSTPLRDASVQVSVTGASGGGGQGLWIVGSLPNQPDAVLSIAAPSGSTPPQDAIGPLGLTLAATGSTASYNVAHYALGTGHNYASQSASTAGSDGTGPTGTTEIIGDPGAFTGIYALLKVDLFNLLSIPDATRAMTSDPNALDTNVNPSAIYAQAIALCDARRAFLLVDPPPNVTTVSGALDWKSSTLGITDQNGAAFWPRLRLPDPLNNYNLRTFAPSGVVAGVYATTDGNRGVWKAPAGINATLNGVQGMTYMMSDQENGQLNPLGLNCLRTFPVYGPVLWGSRTLQGADAETSQWKYVPVRRTALFLEESLYRGTKWVVFEPNDASLWAAIRLNITSFMQTLFLKGAFQGKTPDQAYFVKCDSETTTQADIDNGIVNILVGFAPLKPAEFVVIKIEQLTGQG